MISCYVIAMHLLGVVDGCCYAVSKVLWMVVKASLCSC